MRRAWDLALRIIRLEPEVSVGMQELIATCRELRPRIDWETVDSLPFDDDAERVRWWLLEMFDANPLPAELEDLEFHLGREEWKERFDSCDLELRAAPSWDPPRTSSGSAVLARLVTYADDVEDPIFAELLPLTFAALTIQSALDGLDESVVLDGADARFVTIGCDPEPLLRLGWFGRDGWDRGEFGLSVS